MTNEMATKVRLVKCPKCSKLLPEPAGVPIYSCGGCGTILQGKLGPGDAHKNKQQYHTFPDDRYSSDLSREVAGPSLMKHAPSLPKEEHKDLSSSTQTVSVESTTEGNEEPDRITFSTKPSSSFQEPITDARVHTEKSTEVCSSADLVSHESHDLSSSGAVYSDANASDQDPESKVVQSEEDPMISTEKSCEVCSSSALASLEVQGLWSTVALCSEANASDWNPESEVVLSEEDPTISTEKSSEVCSLADLASHENQELSSTVALCSDTNASDGKPESEVAQSEEPKHDGSVKSLEIYCASFLVDSDSITTTDSCADRKLKTSEGDEEPDKIYHSVEAFYSFMKPDTNPIISTEDSAGVYPSNDLTCDGNQELLLTAALNIDANGCHENPQFVAVQSEGDSKHDGSKSSETDYPSIPVDSDRNTTIDSCAHRKLNTSEKFAPAEYGEPTPVFRKVTGEVSHDEIDHQSTAMLVNASRNIYEEATTFSRESIIKERSILQKQIICRGLFPCYRTVNSNSKSISTVSDVEDLSEGFGMARGHLSRFGTKPEIDEFPPHGWGHEFNSIDGEGTSNRKMRDSFYSSTSYLCERSENILPQNKEELLRMVMELQNQLKKMYSINEERSSSSNFYSYQQSNLQFDLPSSPYPHGTASMYSSSPSTVAWDRESKLDDQMHGYPVLKNPRERAHYPKRHYRPMAGACPLITCYNCSEILHIPEDFLPSSRKRCHWLKCGACSVVLRFSLQDKTHISRYQPQLDKHDNLEGLHGSDPSLFLASLPTQDKEDDYRRDPYGSPGNSEFGIEEASRGKGSSALHQLMGYPSVSQLLS
ncbi:hypothetical protein SAY87_007922 [Trapa incisa]|uniref:Zinc-ribbon domain-containing protein n=1 Tax=Trapa incisa TaxID=236973 RepID=A0AAN7QIS7_9MYRT|nr:hypothetical protein SAY87_007922 [Trapa incisa]